MLMKEERETIVEFGKKLILSNITTGTGGNISIFNRDTGNIAISPSGIDYFKTEPEDVVVLDIDGNIIDGIRKCSSEYLMHKIFYERREDINAVVHTHSRNATTLSCLGWELPAVHYLTGFAKGNVRCIGYQIFGSNDLAESALIGMHDRFAVLLGNHGLLTGGPDINYAFNTAEEIEFCADIYLRCKSVGDPKLLSEDQMAEVLIKFKEYGQKR